MALLCESYGSTIFLLFFYFSLAFFTFSPDQNSLHHVSFSIFTTLELFSHIIKYGNGSLVYSNSRNINHKYIGTKAAISTVSSSFVNYLLGHVLFLLLLSLGSHRQNVFSLSIITVESLAKTYKSLLLTSSTPLSYITY